MSNAPAPDPVPDTDLVANLRVDVHLVPGRARWAWHLIDSRDDSWFESQYEFESPMDAQTSGLARLAELARLPGAKSFARTVEFPIRNHLVIVSRRQEGLYSILSSLFQQSGGIEVIRDRRRSVSAAGRREPERRSQRVDPVARARGWWIVCGSEATPLARFPRESASTGDQTPNRLHHRAIN